MEKYSLKFSDEDLEKKYQFQRNQKLQKPLFYSFVIISLIMNIFLLISQLVHNLNQIPLPTILSCIFDVMQLILGMKYQKYIQQLLLLFNLGIPFYQLTINQNKTTSEEYFCYGSSLTIFSTVIYFICDFYLSLLQIVANVITTQVITAYMSKRVDYVNLFLGVAAAIQLSHTIYKFDQTSRSQFLMNEKESLFLKQSKNFIQKPHFLVQIHEKNKYINVTYMQQFQEYDYQQIGYCYGCFGRHFLRKSFSSDQNLSLEQILFDQEKVKLNECMQVKYGKYNLQIKVLQYGYHDRFVVIVEKGILEKMHEYCISGKTLHTFSRYFQTLSNQIKHNRMIKFGMVSIILLNSFQTKTINLTKLIRRFINEFQLGSFIHFLSFRDQNQRFDDGYEIHIQTFCYQLQIFVAQILLTIQEIAQNKEAVFFILCEFDEYVELKIKLNNSEEFLQRLKDNIFIQSTNEQLLFDNMDQNLLIRFRKSLPFQYNNSLKKVSN